MAFIKRLRNSADAESNGKSHPALAPRAWLLGILRSAFITLILIAVLQTSLYAQNQRTQRISLLPDPESVQIEWIVPRCSALSTNDLKVVQQRISDSWKFEITNTGEKLIAFRAFVLNRNGPGVRFLNQSTLAILKPVGTTNPSWKVHSQRSTFTLTWTTRSGPNVYDRRWGSYKIVFLPMYTEDIWKDGVPFQEFGIECGEKFKGIGKKIEDALQQKADFVDIDN